MLSLEIKDVNGVVVCQMTVPARFFKTGSRGYGLSGKVIIDGKKHQLGLNIVEVGSKDAAVTNALTL